MKLLLMNKIIYKVHQEFANEHLYKPNIDWNNTIWSDENKNYLATIHFKFGGRTKNSSQGTNVLGNMDVTM